jgi:hypothetical protein
MSLCAKCKKFACVCLVSLALVVPTVNGSDPLPAHAAATMMTTATSAAPSSLGGIVQFNQVTGERLTTAPDQVLWKSIPS